MIQQYYTLLILLFLTSGLVSMYMLYYLVQKYRSKRIFHPANTLAVAVFFVTIWNFTSLAILMNSDFSTIYFLEQFKYIGILFIPPTWVILILQLTGYEDLINNKINTTLLYIVPLVCLFFVFTDPLHHLIWTRIELVSFENVFVTETVHGPMWWFLWFYSSFMALIGLLLIGRACFKFKGTYRIQAFVLFIGTLFPWFSNFLFAVMGESFLFTDPTPAFLLFTCLIYIWGVIKFKLVDLIPIAKEIVFNNLKNPIFILDGDNRVIDVSQYTINIFNLDKKKVVGQQIETVVESFPQIPNELFHFKESEYEVQLHITYEDKYFHVTSDFIKDAASRAIGRIITFNDITRIKKTQDALEMANADIREFNRTLEQKVTDRTKEIQHLLEQKDRFITQMSHDFRSPLAPLLTLLPILDKHLTDAKDKEIMQLVLKNIHFLKNHINKIVTFVKLDSPKAILEFEKINLSDIIQDELDKKVSEREQKAAIVNTVPLDIFITADKRYLHQLFDQIFSNAIKYIGEKGMISIDAEQKPDLIKIIIKDTGLGLTERQLTQVFDEFYKADESRHDFTSSGLGLSISKRIVEKHGGNILVESEGLGKGTTVSVTFPISHKKKNNQITTISTEESYDTIIKKIESIKR